MSSSEGSKLRAATDEEILPLLSGKAGTENDDDPEEVQTYCCCLRMRRRIWSETVIVLLMLLVIALGSLNSIASQIMTVPMQNYSFFLSLFNPILYVLLYYGILFFRYGVTKNVTREMLVYPWRPRRNWRQLYEEKVESGLAACSRPFWRFGMWLPPLKFFIVMGICDGLGNILGLIAKPYISGQMSSLMSQTIVVFSIICALLFLGTKYTFWQVFSAMTVTGGAVICLFADPAASGLASKSFLYSLLMAISTLPNAISFTLKEMIFADFKGLDVFVVNSTGSLFQLLTWPIMIPITVLLGQTNGIPLPEYIRDGFTCFAGGVVHGKSCAPMPWPYVVYIANNLLFNITLLVLLKRASALQGFMSLKAIVPITFILYYIPWPLLKPSTVNGYMIVGLVVLLLGLAGYRYSSYVQKTYPRYAGCCSPGLPFGSDHHEQERQLN